MPAAGRKATLLRAAMALAAVVVSFATSPLSAQTLPRHFEKFRFAIDARSAARDLLPPPPKSSPPAIPGGLKGNEDLAQVPEVHFQEPLILKTPKADKDLSDAERDRLNKELASATRAALIATAHQAAKINFLDQKKRDLFLQTLLENRPDLAGLPFRLGDACRLAKTERPDFVGEFDFVRGHFAVAVESLEGGAKRFWKDYDARMEEARKKKTGGGHERFLVAALTQAVGPEPAYHDGLVRRLAALAGPEAAEALAGLGLFSTDADIRQSAVAALQKRDRSSYSAILLDGLRYPWPSVAANAAEAIVALKRVDLAAELVKLLEEPDPRAPVLGESHGVKGPIVRELVRLNHHRNCLLCHPPANTPDVVRSDDARDTTWNEIAKGVEVMVAEGAPRFDPEIIAAPMPIPGQLFQPGGYGRQSSPDIFVRVDVSYLRQDFSMMHKVADAHPWPERQRFDYLVRNRLLTEAEANAHRAALAAAGPSPYRQAAVNALRRLTGKDAGESAEQWRKALGL